MTIMSHIMKRLTALVACLAGLCLTAYAQQYPYQDKSLPAEERAADLLGRLTMEEKASLMLHTSPAIPRLGIRQYNWWSEALHGVARNGAATCFPQPTGMASSFDRDMIYEVFSAVSDEARVKNHMADPEHIRQYQGLTFWTPNINIFRDPRWGRGMETYGEDPYLTGQLGMEVVRGLQGPDDSPVRKTVACAKHYAVHSGPESTRHSYDAEVSERDLRETYLPAFKDLTTKAGVQEVMTAYNRFRGDPCAASDYLVNTILREEWGYKGLVVTDCWALSDFYEPGRHGYSESAAQAAAVAVKNGIDIECGMSFRSIPEAISMGYMSDEDMNANVLRLLTQRFELGEMDNESPWDGLSPDIVEGEAHKELAYKAALESMVLLQNRGGALPLKAEDLSGGKVALVGPNADDIEMMWGNYNAVPKETITLRAALPDLPYFPGCGIIDASYMPPVDERIEAMLTASREELEAMAKLYAVNVSDILGQVTAQRKMRQSFLPAYNEAELLAQLEGIETVIFAGGISPRLEGEEMRVKVPGFSGGDRTDIELPEVQRKLLKALHEAGKKVIFVNFSGGAMGLEPELETCDAILQAWYPGQMGGRAIADLLLGKANPSGKLPVTFYRNIGQLPDFENYDMAGHTYRFFKGSPLFEFGYGLSYSSFKYGRPKVKNGYVEVKVANKGKVEGTEVVQLYVRKKGDADGPQKTLRGFVRVNVAPGKKVKVRIPIDDETFLWWDEDAQNMIPVHGKYQLLVGGSSADGNLRVRNYKFS